MANFGRRGEAWERTVSRIRRAIKYGRLHRLLQEGLLLRSKLRKPEKGRALKLFLIVSCGWVCFKRISVKNATGSNCWMLKVLLRSIAKVVIEPDFQLITCRLPTESSIITLESCYFMWTSNCKDAKLYSKVERMGAPYSCLHAFIHWHHAGAGLKFFIHLRHRAWAALCMPYIAPQCIRAKIKHAHSFYLTIWLW